MKIVAPPASDLDRGGQRVAEYIALFHNGIDIAELYYIYAHRDAVRHQEMVTVSSSSLSSHRSTRCARGKLPARRGDHGGSDTGRPARAGRRRASVAKETHPPTPALMAVMLRCSTTVGMSARDDLRTSRRGASAPLHTQGGGGHAFPPSRGVGEAPGSSANLRLFCRPGAPSP